MCDEGFDFKLAHYVIGGPRILNSHLASRGGYSQK
jgi:hypothetical protein